MVFLLSSSCGHGVLAVVVGSFALGCSSPARHASPSCSTARELSLHQKYPRHVPCHVPCRLQVAAARVAVILNARDGRWTVRWGALCGATYSNILHIIVDVACRLISHGANGPLDKPSMLHVGDLRSLLLIDHCRWLCMHDGIYQHSWLLRQRCSPFQLSSRSITKKSQ